MDRRATRRALLAGAAVTLAGVGTAASAAPPDHSQGRGHGHGVGTGNGRGKGHGVQKPDPQLPPLERPLQMAYFRTWHDRATDPTRPNSMGEIPAEVDVAFVFPDYTPADSPFWTVLRDEYVPTLHSRGTRVVMTTDIRAVLDPAFPDTPEGHRANAEHLIATQVEAYGLDGLDIDMESSLSAEQTRRAVAVFRELATMIGPQSGTQRLFIYDTNRNGDVELFMRTAHLLDYVLVQSYGRSVSSLQATWETFAPHIEPAQYLIGFSFYEERDGNRWNDTSEPFEDSRAVAFADWQPKGLKKGGVFSYAVDRDGVRFLDDQIHHTTYEWSKRIKARMISND